MCCRNLLCFNHFQQKPLGYKSDQNISHHLLAHLSLLSTLLDWTSPSERVSLKFIQWNQSNSLKNYFCKYSKHTFVQGRSLFYKQLSCFLQSICLSFAWDLSFFNERNPTSILCCSNTVQTSNTEFLSLSMSFIFVWNIDIMECTCHRYASPNSFSKNFLQYFWWVRLSQKKSFHHRKHLQ